MIVSTERRQEILGDKRRASRTDIGLAVLLLAGREGLSDEVFFRRSYGFNFRTKAHRGALDVLKHRLRTMLEDREGLELQRLDGRNVVAGTLCAADPRCTQPPGDRALRHLVASGRCSAKDLSARLGISLRSAQQVLKQLVKDGACHVAKDGRTVRYYVEDTTFSEPTQAR
jgi:DNA-binding MarR family transcriptional regulator